MEQGGTVLWLIAILVFFMWGMIFERIWYLSHGHYSYINNLSNQWNARKDKTSWYALQVREKLISQAKFEINKNLSLIQTCVMLAPFFKPFSIDEIARSILSIDKYKLPSNT